MPHALKLHLLSGYVEKENLVGHGNGGVSLKRKDVRRDWEVPDDGKHVVHQTDESMPEFPSQILNSNGRSPKTNDAYYQLLRDGRYPLFLLLYILSWQVLSPNKSCLIV